MARDVFVNQATLAVIGVSESVDATIAAAVLGRLSDLARAVDVRYLNVSELFSETPFVVEQRLTAEIAALQKKTLIIGGGALEGAVTQIPLP